MDFKKELKEGDDIIFKNVESILGIDTEYMDGTITKIFENGVFACCLWGYKSYTELVPWDDIVIIPKVGATPFRIPGYIGTGIILNIEVSDNGQTTL